MFVEILSGIVLGFIIGACLIKIVSNKIIHEYCEENITLKCEKSIVDTENCKLRNIIGMMDDENIELHRKSKYMIILYKPDDDHDIEHYEVW